MLIIHHQPPHLLATVIPMHHGRPGETAVEDTVSAFQEFKVSQWRQLHKHAALRALTKSYTGHCWRTEEDQRQGAGRASNAELHAPRGRRQERGQRQNQGPTYRMVQGS